MAEGPRHEQGLFRIMVAGTAISFGALGAIAASMKDFIHGNAEFSFSYKTIVGFVVGAALGLLLWSVVRRLQRQK